MDSPEGRTKLTLIRCSEPAALAPSLRALGSASIPALTKPIKKPTEAGIFIGAPTRGDVRTRAQAVFDILLEYAERKLRGDEPSRRTAA